MGTLATRNVECFGTPLRRNPTVIGFRRAGGNRGGPFSSKPGLETDGNNDVDGKKRKWFNVDGTKKWFSGLFSTTTTTKATAAANDIVVDGNAVVVGKKKRFF